MQIQFNLFGFQVQISRPVKFGVSTLYYGEEGEPWYFDYTTSFFLLAVFQGWRKAREKTLWDRKSATYLIYRIRESGVHSLIRTRSIPVSVRIHFWSK